MHIPESSPIKPSIDPSTSARAEPSSHIRIGQRDKAIDAVGIGIIKNAPSIEAESPSEEEYLDALMKALDELQVDAVLDDFFDGLAPLNEGEEVEKARDKFLQEEFWKTSKPATEDLDDILKDTSSLRTLEEDDEFLEESQEHPTENSTDELDKLFEELGANPSERRASSDSDIEEIERFLHELDAANEQPAVAVKHTWEEKGKAKADKKRLSQSSESSSSASDLSSSSRSRTPSLIGERIEKLSRDLEIIPKSSSSSSTQLAGSASTSSSSAADRSIALTIYRYVLKHLPRGIARYFSILVVKDGRISISDISNKMIPRLAPRFMKDLSPDQLRNLTQKQFDQMSQDQFAAIGPKLNELGPANLAYIISNRLDEDHRTVFLTMIAEKWGDGDIKDKELKKLFSKLKTENIVDFFGYLDKHEEYTEILTGIFPLAFREEMLEEDLISKLPPILIGDLSNEKLRDLTPKHFDQLNTEQLFAIGPDLEALGHKNLAYIISNKLDHDQRIAFLTNIAGKWGNGRLDDKDLVKLFAELGDTITSDFLSELYATNHELFTEIYPNVFAKTVIHADESYLAELLANPENQKKADSSIVVRNSSGQRESLTPSVIMMKDAHRNRYIINGEDIDPAKKLPMRKEAVYESLYEAAGKNDKLTKQLELFLTQDTISGTTGAYLQKFSVNMAVNPNVSQTYYVLDVFPPNPNDPEDQGFVKVLIINNLTLMDVKVSTDDPSAPPLGYAQAKTIISIPTEDLLDGKTERASVDFNLSPVFDAPPDQLKEPAKYLKKGEDTFDIALVDYEYNEVQFEDDSQTSSDLSNLPFATRQGKLKDQLETNYEDSVAVEYVSQRLHIDQKMKRSMQYDAILAPIQKGIANSLEELKELYAGNGQILEIIDEIEESSKLEENAGKDLATIAKEVTEDLRKTNTSLKFPSDLYGTHLTDPKMRDNMIKGDEEVIKELLLKEMAPFKGKELSAKRKEEIKEKILTELENLGQQAEIKIAELSQMLDHEQKTVESFKSQLLEVLEDASNGADRQEQREIYDDRIAELKEEFNLMKYGDTDADAVTDILELCLEEVSGSLKKVLDPKNGKIEDQINEKFESAKLAMTDIKVNFPERGKIYAEILLDKFFDAREVFS